MKNVCRLPFFHFAIARDMMKSTMVAAAVPETQNSVDLAQCARTTSMTMKRVICARCARPETTCICGTLPNQRIRLQRCQCLVLQHPHEARRKNSSIPIIQFCIEDDSMIVERARRLGQGLSPQFLQKLHHAEHPVWLIYPSPDAIPLSKAIESRKDSDPPVTLLFLDGTWKFAAEMDRANMEREQYPVHMQRVTLSESDLPCTFKPSRFDIRTPPSMMHLSTAECLAIITARLENDGSIYETLMKPLDLTVERWHSLGRSR